MVGTVAQGLREGGKEQLLSHYTVIYFTIRSRSGDRVADKLSCRHEDPSSILSILVKSQTCSAKWNGTPHHTPPPKAQGSLWSIRRYMISRTGMTVSKERFPDTQDRQSHTGTHSSWDPVHKIKSALGVVILMSHPGWLKGYQPLMVSGGKNLMASQRLPVLQHQENSVFVCLFVCKIQAIGSE